MFEVCIYTSMCETSVLIEDRIMDVGADREKARERERERERECCYLICEQTVSMSTGCVRSLSETAERRLATQERPCK